MLSPFYRNMPEDRTGFLRHFCLQLFNRNPDNRANTGILPGNLPPVDADTAKAGGVGHMVIEIAGRPQPPQNVGLICLTVKVSFSSVTAKKTNSPYQEYHSTKFRN